MIQKKQSLLGMLCFILLVALCGCTSNEPTTGSLIGTWTFQTEAGLWVFSTMTLNEDGSCDFSGVEGTWEQDGDHLILSTSFFGTMTYTYEFSDNGNHLTMTNIDTDEVWECVRS